MKTAISRFAFTASIALASALTFSCSNGGSDDNTPLSSSAGAVSSSSDGGGASSSSGGGGASSSSDGGGASSSSGAEGTSSSSDGGGVSSSSVEGGASSSSFAVSYGDSVEYEGETYPTVIIGAQTWFAKNLNYEVNTSTYLSRCYENQESNCAAYGRLYNWKAAKDVCPQGWHLPSQQEWNALISHVGGTGTASRYLKADDGWAWDDYNDISGNGEDTYGFAALPGGSYRDSESSFYDDVGEWGYWWAIGNDEAPLRLIMAYESSDANFGSVSYTDDLYSVRCIKD